MPVKRSKIKHIVTCTIFMVLLFSMCLCNKKSKTDKSPKEKKPSLKDRIWLLFRRETVSGRTGLECETDSLNNSELGNNINPDESGRYMNELGREDRNNKSTEEFEMKELTKKNKLSKNNPL